MFGLKNRVEEDRKAALDGAVAALRALEVSLVDLEREIMVPRPSRLIAPLYHEVTRDMIFPEDFWRKLRWLVPEAGSHSSNFGLGVRDRASALADILGRALKSAEGERSELVEAARAALGACSGIHGPLALAEAHIARWREEAAVKPVALDSTNRNHDLEGAPEAKRQLARNLHAIAQALVEPGGDPTTWAGGSESLQLGTRAHGLRRMIQFVLDEVPLAEADPFGWKYGRYRKSTAPQGDQKLPGQL